MSKLLRRLIETLMNYESYLRKLSAKTLDPNIPPAVGQDIDFLGQYVGYLVQDIDLPGTLRDCSDYKRFAKHFEGFHEN
jgi:hypothetical protein